MSLPLTPFSSGPPHRLPLVAPEELASLSEIADLLGVTKRTAQRYIDRPDFPEPLGTVAVARIWRRADIEAWGKATLPLQTGRPRKREEDGPDT